MGAGVTKSKMSHLGSSVANPQASNVIKTLSATEANVEQVKDPKGSRPNNHVDCFDLAQGKAGALEHAGLNGPLDPDTTNASGTVNTPGTAVTFPDNVCNRVEPIAGNVSPKDDSGRNGKVYDGEYPLDDKVVVIVKKVPKTSRYWSSGKSISTTSAVNSPPSLLEDRTVADNNLNDTDTSASPSKRHVEKSSRYMSPIVSKVKEIPKAPSHSTINNWLREVDYSEIRRHYRKK